MRVINEQDVFDIIDDLRGEMTVVGYWSVIERVKALPSATCGNLDCISRQDAIRIVDGIDTWQAGWRGNAIESIKALPSAQPDVPDINVDDMISRQAAIDAVLELGANHRVSWKDAVIDTIDTLPSAQPEIIRCKDCKFYTSVTAHCEIRGKGLYLIRGMEDFCSRAERRTV